MDQQSSLNNEGRGFEGLKEDKNNSNKNDLKNENSYDKNSNVIFVGDKPLVNYIRGVITQFLKNESKEVIIKSRGKFISKAVDVAEVAKRSLQDKNVKVKNIIISSESFQRDGKKTNISTMDIVLSM